MSPVTEVDPLRGLFDALALFITGVGNDKSALQRLDDGTYVFQVTEPSGKTLLSTDLAKCRQFTVAAGIIIFSQIATRRVKAIPSGIQNFWEWLVEGLHNFLENIIGRELVAKGFWFFATIFIFILFVNWFGLIPGIGTIGWGHYDGLGNFHVDRPLLRGGNADLNMTTAMSAIFFVMWFVWAIQANGVGGFLKHLFGPKGETTGVVKILMVVIFFAVGWLEVISIMFRPIALSFRLFGNIYAGESILEAMSTMNPWLSPILPIPFYFLEVLVGFVQALVFMLLTAVFTMLIAEHQGGPEHAH